MTSPIVRPDALQAMLRYGQAIPAPMTGMLQPRFLGQWNERGSIKNAKPATAAYTPQSTTTTTMFAEGGKGGVKLDAPKGIATTADQLWVADIDVVRVFDKKTGKAIKTIDLKSRKATFLNDVAVGGDSAVYIASAAPCIAVSKVEATTTATG